jgi:molybdenum cofactor cytidylyltransferase
MSTARAIATRPAAAMVLAAGSASRFGTDKLVAALHGRALLQHVIDTACGIPLTPCLVVVGSEGGAGTLVHDLARDLVTGRAQETDAANVTLRAVVNPDAARGLGTSVRAGLATLLREVDVEVGEVVVLLGDQPGIDPQVIESLVLCSRAQDVAVRARYADGPGHPVVLPRRVWPLLLERLAGHDGDEGVRAFAEGIGLCDVEVDGVAPPDVDRPADLEALRGGPARAGEVQPSR